jgi:RNA polymerase sigma factor (sigma-70 family)
MHSFNFQLLKDSIHLPDDEQTRLAMEAQRGDKEKRDVLLNTSYRLIYKEAKKLAVKVPVEDLFDQGTFIFMENTIPSFNPSKGASFATFAAANIHFHLLRYIQNTQYTVRHPVHWQDKNKGRQITILSTDVVNAEECTLLDRFQSNVVSPDEAAVRKDIRGLLNTLNERERIVITHIYGFDGGAPLSNAKIGRKLGVCRAYVGQLKDTALVKLRARL